MSAIFKKRWAWITIIFLVINTAGLLKIISLLEEKKAHGPCLKKGVASLIDGMLAKVVWPAKKAVEDVAGKFVAKKDLEVKLIKPEMDGVNPRIEIEFSRDVALDEIRGYVDVKPKVDFHMEDSYYGVRLYGDFRPGESYEVEVLKGMPPVRGLPLEETVKRTVVIPDYKPTFKFKTSGMYMSLKGSLVIPLEVINIDRLELRIHRVYDNNVVYLLNNMNSYSIPDDLGLDVFEKEINAKGERNEKKEVLIDLRDLLPGDSHGLFFMTVEKPDEYYWNRKSKLILTTDIGIVAKKSDSGLLVWLNYLSDTLAVGNATVKVFTRTNQQVLQGMTDRNGLVHFKDVDWSGDRKPFVVTASGENDLSFIELEECVLPETDFDIQGRPYLSAGYDGFLYTDRGIYRPGERIHMRAVLRGVGCEVPERFPVVFDIKRPDGRQLEKLNGVLSEYGTVDVDVDIPGYALTGGYTAHLKLPGSDKVIGRCTFNIEEFMPDRIKVAVDLPDKRLNLSDTIPIKVKAEQFFGTAASGRQVEVICSLRPVEFKPEGYSEYVFTDRSKEFSKRTVHIGEKESDENGEAGFELKFPKGIMPPSALDCSISAVVKELGGRAVTSYAGRAVDAYPHYTGIRTLADGYASVNEEAEFDYVFVSPEGDKVAPPEARVSVCKVIWSSVLKKDESGRYRYVTDQREELILERDLKPREDGGVFAFTPASRGKYIVRIRSGEEEAHAAGLEFYCSGYGYMPWAMERPDRIELELDKPVYKAGDEARLVIKSPFKGKALVTVSKDDVLFTEAIELTDTTQEIPITIDEGFAPNAYCAVTVIRKVAPEEQWAAHRAYGVIPVTLDNSGHRLSVKINSPTSASPEDAVRIDIDVSGEAGNSGAAELSVALVDEGILRLTGFKAPDPFDFFYGKRANNIATSDIYSLLIPEFGKKKIGADSSPAGDEAAQEPYDMKKHLAPISAERVKPVVLWKSNIVTDELGRARAEFKIPRFTGNLKVMVVAAGGRDFGNAESDIKVTEPLMVKPTVPRFLSAGDEFILPVSVFNSTGADGRATVTLSASEGFEVIGGTSFNIEVGDNKEGAVSFKVKAPSLPQKGEIRIAASMGGYSTAREIELPVRPPAPFTTICGSGVVKAQTASTVGIPGSWLEGTQGYSLLVMSYPALQFAGGISYLMGYPYGCVEQTTSCVFPLLYLGDIAAVVDPARFNFGRADDYVDAGIKRVLSMQTYKGGFASWPGYQDINDWGSVYATDFLIEADKAGYTVPKLEKKAALNYCEKILAGKDSEYPLGLKAYSCFVLARAGRLKSSWIRRLQERKDDLPASSRFHLASALAALGDVKAMSAILGQGFPDASVKRETGGSLNSRTRENAIALSVYMDIDPESEMVPVLVKRLESSMKNGSWQTTQDNAMALLALGKYTRFIEDQHVDYTGSVSVGREVLVEFDDEAGAEIENVDLGGKDVRISVEGRGTAYYYWSAEGVPVSGEVKEEDNGIKVRREFLTREGKPLGGGKIKHGEIIVVDISLKSSVSYDNVIVADLLPACFEIENPRVSTSESVGWIGEDVIEPEHIDIRDDRFLMFTFVPCVDKVHYRYIVRAVTKGKFALPPVSASCMYDPSVSSVHGKGSIEVGD